MTRGHWIPVPMRAAPPELLLVRYAVPGRPVPLDAGARIRAALPRRLRPGDTAAGPVPACLEWDVETMVYGLIRREVTERVDLVLRPGPPAALEVRCHPRAVHEAHAAGLAGVMALAAAGLLAGPQAAASVLLAGSFVAVYARELAVLALEGRLRRVAERLGEAVWPGTPAEVTLSRCLVET